VHVKGSCDYPRRQFIDRLPSALTGMKCTEAPYGLHKSRSGSRILKSQASWTEWLRMKEAS
jgi:hypothetical protein